MVNLDILMDQTIDFKLNGELIKVKEPSVKVTKKMTSMGDDINKIVEVLEEVLNNNTSAVKFIKADLEKLPLSVLKTIIDSVVAHITGTEKN